MDDDIDCNRVILALYEFLDNELTSEGRRHVETHLDGCPHCYSVFDFEAELRIVVRARLQVEVPSTLQSRIVAALEREGLRPLPPSYPAGPLDTPRPGFGSGPPPLGGPSPLR